jgi:hypothetical protein
MNLSLFDIRSFAFHLEKYLVRDRIIIYLLGATVACLTVLGSALIYLIGNLIIPIVCTVGCIAGIQWYVLSSVKDTTTQTVGTLSEFYLSKTQQFLVDTHIDTSVGLVLLACRQKNAARLEVVFRFISQDYGNDFLYDWLTTKVCTQLTEKETDWLWMVVTGKK